jgi:glycosyltransferase involved in cell wall biosynthesis
VLVTLANAFLDQVHRVDLVLAKADGPYLPDIRTGVRVIDLDSFRVSASLPRLVRYLRRERPAAMLSAMNHANIVAIAAKRLARSNVRLIVSERSHVSASMANARSLRARSIRHLIRWLYPQADGIVAVSDGVAQDLASVIGFSSARIKVIPNPVVSARILDLSHRPVQHPWLLPGQPPVILSVGRLSEPKDFSLLVRAFARVRSQRPVRLVILGEGEMRSSLEGLVAELALGADVLLPGFERNPLAWMRQCRLFVLSSAWEGLPNALIEAMACGVPVVATDCPSGPAEILENGKWGRLVPVGDEAQLAQAIIATLDSPTTPDVSRRAAHFSDRESVAQYLSALLPGTV